MRDVESVDVCDQEILYSTDDEPWGWPALTWILPRIAACTCDRNTQYNANSTSGSTKLIYAIQGRFLSGEKHWHEVLEVWRLVVQYQIFILSLCRRQSNALQSRAVPVLHSPVFSPPWNAMVSSTDGERIGPK